MTRKAKPAVDLSTNMPPQDKRGLEARGYSTVALVDLDDYTPRGACPWARRRLVRGANPVNKNVLADWQERDPDFAGHVAAGRITIGDDFQPLLEVVRQRDGGTTAREAILERRLADLEYLIADLVDRKGRGK